MNAQDYAEIDAALEQVYEVAMEADRILDPKTRDSLPDEAFALVYTTKDGKRKRTYPLIVKNDPKVTHELISKAIQFFHYAKPDQKEELAKKIIAAIRKTGTKVTISSRSQIWKYVDIDDAPSTVTISYPEKNKK